MTGLQYDRITKATFLSRPNRFVALVSLHGQQVRCHVKNTGRCRELLVPGATVYVQQHDDPGRRTACSLITVDRAGELINIDSQAPNRVAAPWLQNGHGFFETGPAPLLLRPETVFEDSRFDFYAETLGPSGDVQRHFIEVKGVTLEENGVARFPDAPTSRGEKHLRGLIRVQQQGMQGHVLFVVQMACAHKVVPNGQTDPAFAAALRQAKQAGVHLCAVRCRVQPDSLEITGEIPVEV
ncbi:MAG: DNA/RNA nuclease SfsA [Acutalibacteraceae bacterium]